MQETKNDATLTISNPIMISIIRFRRAVAGIWQWRSSPEFRQSPTRRGRKAVRNRR
jgi:hypothetical protein